MYGSPKKRVRKAYWAALIVFFRYSKLNLASKIFGDSYYQKRIEALNIKNGIYIKDKILELQGLFIKVGQLLSVLSNVLPDSFRKPLEELQDRVPPISNENFKAALSNELPDTIDSVFSEVNEVPIATASIGQTHRASLKEGEDVVIKIQHPEIEEVADLDLKIIQRLMKIGARQLKMKSIAESFFEIEEMIRLELDYTNEAREMVLFRENLSKDEVRIPLVYPEYTTPKLVVMSYEEGFKINDIEKLDQLGIDKSDLAKRLLKLFAKQIFDLGKFHADPHPGNIFVNEKGEIVLLDFGAVGKLDEEMRRGVAQFILATLNFDADKMTESLMQMGFVVSDEEARAMSKKIIEIGLDFLKNEVEITSLNINDIHFKSGKASMFKLLQKIDIRNLGNSFQIPKDWILLQRTAILVLGICNELDRDLNPMDVLKPHLNQFVLGKKSGIGNLVKDFVKKQVYSLFQLPYELNRFLSNANKGNGGEATATMKNLELMKFYSNRSLLSFVLSTSVFLLCYFFERKMEWYVLAPLLLIGGILIIRTWTSRRLYKEYKMKVG